MASIKKNYKNPISRVLADYREDYKYNWDWYSKNISKFNEYLHIQFKDGDNFIIQDEDWFNENTSLPRFNASKILYVSRFYGCGCETITTRDLEIDTNRITLFNEEGKIFFRYTMTEEELRGMRKEMDEHLAEHDETDGTLFCIDYCKKLASTKSNIKSL